VQQLVTELLANQEEHAAGSSGSGDDRPGQRQDQKQPAAAKGGDASSARRRCSPLMGYALKRLARGLASSRDGARQGYAAAFAVLLAHAAGNGAAAAEGGGKHKKLKQQHVGAAGWLDLSGALALVETSLPVTGSMKGTVSDCSDALVSSDTGKVA